MAIIVDVLYKADGSIIALGFPPPAREAEVQPKSGPVKLPGQLAGQFELPSEIATERQPELNRLMVDITTTPHRLKLK